MSIPAITSRLRRLIRGQQPAAHPGPTDSYGADEQSILDRARPLTMTSRERLIALVDAVTYVIQRQLPGAFAECGVWKGGSVLAMILRLQQLGINDRDIYLFDTFEGMTEPTENDTSRFETSALSTWTSTLAAGEKPWKVLFDADRFNEEDVRRALLSTGYPAERLHFVRGKVEDTVPQHAPETLALLRLDTDWYESTRHELHHLWPRLQTGGVMIIDDYGHWDGCRKAVDEYFGPKGQAAPILLNRIDYTGRVAIKC